MKRRVVDLLMCRDCRNRLRLQVFTSEERTYGDHVLKGHAARCREYCSLRGQSAASLGEEPPCQSCYQEEVMEGTLTCVACGALFPIISGIPRLLGDDLKHNLYSYHPDFFRRYGEGLLGKAARQLSSPEIGLKDRTLKHYSYQWNTFSQMFEEYGEHWKAYLPSSIPESFFEGKIGLDAGCGFGRHISRAATAATDTEMVGVDLSEAVEAAYKNTAQLPNVHIVQGGIYNLPFRRGSFDFIYSIGVLHHLPRPAEGFRRLSDLLERGQSLFIWCYSNEKPRRLAFYEALRRLTTKLPFTALYYLCYVPALSARLFLNFPAMMLGKFGPTASLAGRVPYGFYKTYPFRVLHADLVDVFAVPVIHYFSPEELGSWYADAGMEVQETKRSVSGWTLFGTK